MFEIIKVFVEQVFKLISIDRIIQKKEKHKLSLIGVDLFSLYTNLNNIYVTGLLILQEIEKRINQWEEIKQTGRKTVNLYRLPDLLSIQSQNISWFAISFARLSRHIDIVDPEATRAISLFLSTKKNIMGILLHQINSQNIRMLQPSSTTSRPALLFSMAFEDSLLQAVDSAKHSKYSGGWRTNELLLEKVDYSGEDTMEIRHEVSEREIQFLSDYLRTRRPAEQLDALRLILDRLHERLIANFEVKDVLLRVGEHTPQTSSDGLANWIAPRRPVGLPQ